MGLSVAGSGSTSQGQPDPMTQTAHEAVESQRSIRTAPWRGEGSKGQVICPRILCSNALENRRNSSKQSGVSSRHHDLLFKREL